MVECTTIEMYITEPSFNSRLKSNFLKTRLLENVFMYTRARRAKQAFVLGVWNFWIMTKWIRGQMMNCGGLTVAVLK